MDCCVRTMMSGRQMALQVGNISDIENVRGQGRSDEEINFGMVPRWRTAKIVGEQPVTPIVCLTKSLPKEVKMKILGQVGEYTLVTHRNNVWAAARAGWKSIRVEFVPVCCYYHYLVVATGENILNDSIRFRKEFAKLCRVASHKKIAPETVVSDLMKASGGRWDESVLSGLVKKVYQETQQSIKSSKRRPSKARPAGAKVGDLLIPGFQRTIELIESIEGDERVKMVRSTFSLLKRFHERLQRSSSAS